jgi:hypothetical protein
MCFIQIDTLVPNRNMLDNGDKREKIS